MKWPKKADQVGLNKQYKVCRPTTYQARVGGAGRKSGPCLGRSTPPKGRTIITPGEITGAKYAWEWGGREMVCKRSKPSETRVS